MTVSRDGFEIANYRRRAVDDSRWRHLLWSATADREQLRQIEGDEPGECRGRSS